MNESSFKKGKSDVRQGTTDRGSTSIANSVFSEVQRLQHLVLTAKQTQTHLDNAPLLVSIQKSDGVSKECLYVKNIFMNESSFKMGQSDVRQGNADQGSTSIAKTVVIEIQSFQRLILAASQTQKYLEIVPLSNRMNRVAPKKISL